ncbi:MAG: DUF2231 domain-containing protein [Elusimicrobia bacterium]|nr:DUF2231 domain-containing protein [Elusimicrobiota bacterium]
MQWYHIHPAVVHFPIALLSAGVLFQLLAWKRNRPDWDKIGVYCLGCGAVAALGALGTGLLAEELAPHIPEAWRVLGWHERAGYGVVSLSSGLFLWRWKEGFFVPHPKWLYGLLTLLLLGFVSLSGFLGGRLVFEFGMGVKF